MARWEFRLPDLGEGIAEGEIVAWLVRTGDVVKEDQPMLEVMTDKATVTITAPRAGTVTETRGRVGEVVQVHSVLVVFELDGMSPASPERARNVDEDRYPVVPESTPAHSNGSAREYGHDGGNGHGGPELAPDGTHAAAPRRGQDQGATAVGDIRESLPGTAGPLAQAYFNAKPLATPATRKLARDMNIDLRRVPPSGPQGRVTQRDLEAFRSVRPAPHLPPHGGVHATPVVPSPAAPLPRGALEERVPLAGLRRRIAQKMQQSTQTAAHFTFVEECDVTELRDLRARLKPAAEAQGVKLSFLPFIVKATVAALKKHPTLNTALDETTQEIVFRKYFHIGIATATDAGLIVPVVKDADRRSLLDVAREIDRLAAEARAGKARLEDVVGSTFTITSLGAQGGLFATPIINYPEVAILGVHQMKQRPVVKDGQIVIGEVMLLSLSFDHRVVDGHVGAAFAYEIISYLEQPERLFLEMS
jgi:pyruvate dehydrogenase E2 component (dihydrolipoamide acetyltransferase)